jgi:hypothetical protein
MQGDIVHRLYAALPGVQQWIDEFLSAHDPQTRAVSTLGFPRLPICFPQELLEHAKVIAVPSVPFPPVARFGLPELAPFQQMSFAGITFRDTIVLQEGQVSESLHFHEMVHVVQWARLGATNFLLAYGVGLLQFGYENSPLEEMAYTLQQDFDSGKFPEGLPGIIEARTDSIWESVAPILQAGGGG